MEKDNIKLVSESGKVSYTHILGITPDSLFYLVGHYQLFNNQVKRVKSAELI